MTRAQKAFRIETMLAAGAAPRAVEGSPDLIEQRHRELMEELRALRTLMKTPAPVEISSETVDLLRREMQEAGKLKVELDAIQEAIQRTKQEIATLHRSGFEGEEMRRVTGELDAIVTGTEMATNQILASAEAIDEAAANLMASLKDDHALSLANEIQERVVKVFEACNFQDLTGQRITKVVNVLQFIEDRIMRMMDIWGGMESFRAIEDDLPKREGEAALLNGPGLAGEAGRVSQDEIDALFD